MNREFINTYMQKKNIPSGYLKTWYNFESGIATGSAGLIYNQVYTTGNHFFDPANYDGNLKSGVMAGISIGNDTELTSTTVYASDFSSGTDSWSGGVTTTTDPVTGSGQVLKRAGIGPGVHYMRRYSLGMTIGKKYNITGKVFIDPLGSNIQKVLIYHMDGWYGLFVDKPSTAQWVEFSLDFEAKGDYMTLYAHNGSGISFTAGGHDDFYIKDFVIKETTSPFSGNFDHNEMVQISDDVNHNNWTTLFDITTSSQQNLTGQTKILLSSMETSGDTSGFHIGLNGYNHPFITYASTDGNKYTHTFSKEASNRSLLSFSFNSDGKSLSIGKHSPKEDYLENFNTKSINISNTWTLGGFKEYLNDASPGNHIRSFDGKMNHFMLFNPSLKGLISNNFSDFLFINNYEKGEVKQREITSVQNSTGAYIVSGVVGTGITGYEKVLVNTIDGIGVYMNSGITGELSGDVIEYTNQSETVTSYESYLADEVKTFDDSISLNFFNKNLSFLKDITKGYDLPQSGSLYIDSTREDIHRKSISGYEVSTATTVRDNTDKTATWNNLSGAFILGTGVGNKNINLFRNGLLQRPGTLNEVNSTETDGTGFADYIVLDSRYIYSNNRYKESDQLVYEECDLPNIIGGYTKGQASTFFHGSDPGDSNYFFVDNSYFVNRDIYFGGLKLMSGVDYERFSSSIIAVHTNNLNHGVFSWIENFNQNVETGHHDNVLYLNNKLMDEIVWLSGIRQTRDLDYIKTADFSVLNSGYKFNLTENNYIIYSGESGNFNR